LDNATVGESIFNRAKTVKRIIITGATGFVGSNLTRRLLQDGHRLHLLVRPEYNPWRIQDIRRDVRLYKVDFSDEQALKGIIRKIRPDWIFHLAAYGAYSWQTDLKQMIKTNIISTINLLEACLKTGFEAFINTGSSSEYGFKNHSPSEKEMLEPNSHYAITKASTTLFCRYTAQSRGVKIYTLRLYSVYGPYEDPRRLVPTLIRYGLKRKLPPLASPDAAHDYVYIDDVVRAYILAVTLSKQESGAVYNVGSGTQSSLQEVVETARKVFGISAQPVWNSMPKRIWDTAIWVADNRLIKDVLGWQPKYTFEQGFRLTLDWLSNIRSTKAQNVRRKNRKS